MRAETRAKREAKRRRYADRAQKVCGTRWTSVYRSRFAGDSNKTKGRREEAKEEAEAREDMACPP